MTSNERFAQIQIKVSRAKYHLSDLEQAISAYFATNPYVVGTKIEDNTRRLVYYLVSVKETPESIMSITGDILHNLRSALDHLAYQLFIAAGGTHAGSRHIQFPIVDNIGGYEKAKTNLLQGLATNAIAAVDAIKPYNGGNDVLWRLHKLENIDKHRTIITGGSSFRSLDLGAHMSTIMQQSSPDLQIPIISAFFRPADTGFPLKAGYELFSDAPGAIVNDNIQFRFEIAFGEVGIIHGEPLLDTMRGMLETVDHLIRDFKLLLE